MAGDVWRLLLQKKSGHTAKGTRPAQPVKRVRRDALIARRDVCMTQIMRLRADGNASGNLATKAYQLLTAHWAASSWRARIDIVRTAEWLLGISKKTIGVPMPDKTERDGDSRDRSGSKAANIESLVS